MLTAKGFKDRGYIHSVIKDGNETVIYVKSVSLGNEVVGIGEKKLTHFVYVKAGCLFNFSCFK